METTTNINSTLDSILLLTFMKHRLNEKYAVVSVDKKVQQIQMILENLRKKYMNRLPVCTSKLNNLRDLLVYSYIPPAYYIYFN
jgi:hypothetical protein